MIATMRWVTIHRLLTWPLVPALALAGLLAAGPAAAQAVCDPDQLLGRFRGELVKQDWNDAQKRSFAAQVLGASGSGMALFDFIDAATGGSYQVAARKLIDGKLLQTTVLPGGVSRDRIQRLAVMVAERRPITAALAEPAGRLGGHLKAFQIGLDLVNAVSGDDGAKLKLIKAAYDRQFDAATALVQTRALRAAMGSVAFLDYALSSFIDAQYAQYEEFWWQAYSRFHNARHKQIVTGADSWAGLIASGGHAAVERRLHSFWDDALENAAIYHRRPSPFQASALAAATYRSAFAARYYKDFLHPTLKTYFQRQAAAARDEEYAQSEQLCRELNAAGAAVRALQTLLAGDGDALTQAILKYDIGAVRQQLAAGADVNAIHTTASGERYPLVWLAALLPERTWKAQILNLLLGAPNVSKAQPDGQRNTVVYLALHNKFYDAALQLIRAGFPFEFNVRREQPMLVLLARAGDARAVAILLDAGINPNQATATGGATALMFAAHEGHLDVVRLLVERGADPRRVTDKGVTVLHHAEHRKHQPVIDYLRTVLGETPVQIAGAILHRDGNGQPIRPRYRLDSAFVGHLIPPAGMRPPLQWQVSAEPSGSVAMRTGDSDARHQVYFEMQPMRTGAARLRLAVTDAAGARVQTDVTVTIDERSEVFEQRIVEASKTGDWATLRRVLGEHPDVLTRCVGGGAQGGDSKCPAQGGVRGVRVASVVMLNAVASVDDPSLVPLLIGAGADPNARTSRGVPAVLLALAAGNGGMMNALLGAGADPNQAGPQGLTLLHLAAQRGDMALVERLIAAGARPRADARGHTPGYYLFWLHNADPALAARLGYGEARGYVERRERRAREAQEAAEFAQAMAQAAAAAAAQHRAQRSAARQPSASSSGGRGKPVDNPLGIAQPGSKPSPPRAASSGGGYKGCKETVNHYRNPYNKDAVVVRSTNDRNAHPHSYYHDVAYPYHGVCTGKGGGTSVYYIFPHTVCGRTLYFGGGTPSILKRRVRFRIETYGEPHKRKVLAEC